MLARKSYEKAYVDEWRARFAAQVEAYDKLVASADPAAAEAFEPAFFGNLLRALDHTFVHRMRGQEGKGANPLSEVRERSDAGETLSRDEFVALSNAFFDAIEERFPPE